jgi:D-threonate/D-erythronate kinase
MNLPRMLVLADDLSGAADCGVAFIHAGLQTIVALGDVAESPRAEVLSIDADTRGLGEEQAADTVGRLVRKYARDPDLLLFKKIDSTLRGHVAAELAAVLDAYGSLQPGSERPVAVLAPAFPSIGRTTVDGVQLVHGNPLHKHEIWRLQGLTHRPYLPDMLQKARLTSTLLPLDIIRSAGLFDAMVANHANVLVCDAVTDSDLEAIVRASMRLRQKTIWVGSAGLAHHLPQAALAGASTTAVEVELPPLSGPLLFVIGSLSRRSFEQMQVLTSSSATLRLSVPPDILLAGQDSAQWQEYEQLLNEAIGMGRDVLLGPSAEIQVDLPDRRRLSSSLAQMTSSVSVRIGAVIAAGGETARMVLQSWGVTGLRLRGELEKGVPISTTEGWSRKLPVITKAGDFGRPETLLHCTEFFRQTKGRVYE